MNRENKTLIDFITTFSSLTPPSVAGVAALLNVKMVTGKNEDGTLNTRKLDEILSDCIDSFCGLPRDKRRKLLAVMKKAAKDGRNKKNMR